MKHRTSLIPVACPECGGPSEMDPEMGEFTTDVAWEGPHDPNGKGGTFGCAAGHRFRAMTHVQCSCGWSGAKPQPNG